MTPPERANTVGATVLRSKEPRWVGASSCRPRSGGSSNRIKSAASGAVPLGDILGPHEELSHATRLCHAVASGVFGVRPVWIGRRPRSGKAGPAAADRLPYARLDRQPRSVPV